MNRTQVYKLKLSALEAIWQATGAARWATAACEQFRKQRARHPPVRYLLRAGQQLGRDWHTWPAEYQRPQSVAVDRLASEQADRVRFHQWLQWLLDEQLATAGRRGVAIVQDLPIGVKLPGRHRRLGLAGYSGPRRGRSRTARLVHSQRAELGAATVGVARRAASRLLPAVH